MSDPLLEVENLNVHFETYDGTAKVLNGVDFTVDRGETVSVVGETGCGKSVTMRTILGLLEQPPGKIADGSITFDGTDLLNIPESKWNQIRGPRISIIMQDPMTSLNPVLTVGEQMTDVLKWQGSNLSGLTGYIRGKFRSSEEHRERAIEMLEEVQIAAPERVFKSYPIELSGGMRQRVLIAIALLSEPDLLIADEPGTALDVTTEKKILGLFDDLIEDHDVSVIYVTHDLGVARSVSDTINVMYAGEIVEQAPTKELFRAPKHPYTRGLLESIPKLSRSMSTGIDGHLPDYTDPPNACRFAPRCEFAEDSCYEVFPYQRETDTDHVVACHLHAGKKLHERHYELPEEHIGPPPWKRTVSEPNGGSQS